MHLLTTPSVIYLACWVWLTELVTYGPDLASDMFGPDPDPVRARTSPNHNPGMTWAMELISLVSI